MCVAREEWYSLYTDAVETVWREERAELRKTAMLVHILTLELTRVKDMAESELSNCRNKFNLVDNIKTEKITPEVKHVMPAFQPKITPIMITKHENLAQSYVSPDLFHHDSFNFTDQLLVNETNIKTETSTEKLTKHKNIIEEKNDDSIIFPSQQTLSPKLNRPRNLFNIKKLKSLSTIKKVDKDGFKFPVFEQQPSPPTKLVDEVIQATPEPKKQKRLQKSQKKYKQTKLTGNTLTQMYPSLCDSSKTIKVDDSETTYHISQNLKKDEDVDIMNTSEKENCHRDLNGFENFLENYNEVPKKASTPIDKKKPKCKKCLEYGIKCAQHKILSESYNKTYSGFWDVQFTEESPNGEDSDSSIRF